MSRSPSRLERLLPVVGWVRRYRGTDLRFDLLAGTTLAAFAVPESLAYASLAGLQPQVGLYAGMAAMLTYAVFGSSRLLGVGVTSALAITVAGTVGGLADGDPTRAVALAALATLIAGAAALIGWVCRLGFIANLVSRSVLTGFTAGAGLYIASTQLAGLFGVEDGTGDFFVRVAEFARAVDQTHLLTLGIGLAAMALLVIARLRAPRVPMAFIVVALALVAAVLFHVDDHGVEVVGAIPMGLPTPSLPTAALSEWRSVLPLGLSLFLLSYVEGVSAARSLPGKHGHVDPGQELLANGAGNVLSGLLRGMPVGGSLTRSLVNVEAGARTQLSGGVAGALLIVVLAFLTGLFSRLPHTVLAAIVLVAVAELVHVRALRQIFARSKREFVIAALTGISVLGFGMMWGLLVGVALSVLDLLERATFPHTAELGRVPDSEIYVDRERHPEFSTPEGVLVVRIDASLMFTNAHRIKDEVFERIQHHPTPVRLLVLDLGPSPTMDLSGTDMLDELAAALEVEGIEMKVAAANAADRRLLRTVPSGRFAKLDPETTIERVVEDWRS